MKNAQMKNIVLKNGLAVALVAVCTMSGLAADRKEARVDPDDAYKNNCVRCHSAVRQYSPRTTATILNHMRVRANLTVEETQAILEYLTDNAPTKPALAQPAKSSVSKDEPR
jgi:mono/diheme cytochrome c family protein